MASAYANQLSTGLDPGPCGMPEIHETERAVRAKVQALARMIESSNYVVVHTGAGISTSCGIPDFRGPNGIWTIQKRIKAQAAKEAAATSAKKTKLVNDDKHISTSTSNDIKLSQKEKDPAKTDSKTSQSRKRKRADASESNELNQSTESPRKRIKSDDEIEEEVELKQESDLATGLASAEVSWDNATPGKTHMALMALTKKGVIKYIVTQNVDGLHIKSGVSPSKISELHGNVFKEKCDECYTSAYHDKDLKSLGLKRTGRRCQQPGCQGWMCDAMVDWHQPLPDDELDRAEEHSDKADLSICIGTSLRVSPANDLPLYSKRNGGKLVIINLQQTELDKSADMTIRARCDLVLELLMPLLHTKLPEYGSHTPMKFVLPPKWEPPSSSSSSESSDSEEDKKKKSGRKLPARKPAPPKSVSSNQKPKTAKRLTKNSQGKRLSQPSARQR